MRNDHRRPAPGTSWPRLRYSFTTRPGAVGDRRLESNRERADRLRREDEELTAARAREQLAALVERFEVGDAYAVVGLLREASAFANAARLHVDDRQRQVLLEAERQSLQDRLGRVP